MRVREAKLTEDYDAVWNIFSKVIQGGDTYVFSPETNKEELAKHWFAPYMKTFVAEEDGKILGTYILKQNQIDLGSHIANASYMVHPESRGKGVGKVLCEHSLATAKELGFYAIQFNIVVSTNAIAVKLWKKFGFEIIGIVPEAFQHMQKGLVDAYIMYRKL